MRRRFALGRNRGGDGADGEDTGDARTWTLAALVGVMIVAAIVALVFVAAGNSSSSPKHQSRQVEAKGPTHRSRSATPTAPASTAPSPPATTPTPTSSSSPVSDAQPSSTPAGRSSSSHAKPAKRVVYTVKKGDNLSVIAWWFHEHGFGAIYERNKSVIGSNPNLIFPGQKIIISGGSMSMGG